MRSLPTGGATARAGRALSISVVVPTYRRPDNLRRCLEALVHQVPAPGSVVVVVRDEDAESVQVVADFAAADPVRLVRVGRPGVIAALAEGISACETDIVATTDDDAIPRPGWIEALLSSYSNEVIGGVGGPDLVHVNGRPVDGAADRVGQVTWFGRLIGNHHLGWRYSGDVDVLKGVNMSLRKHLWVLDHRLLGAGAQTDYELGVCLRARTLGYRLVFTPEAVVDHYPAYRPMGDVRGDPRPQHVYDRAHNRLLVLLSTARGPRQVGLILAYELLLGRREAPAPASFLALLADGVPIPEASRRLQSAMSGRAKAVRLYLHSRRISGAIGGAARGADQRGSANRRRPPSNGCQGPCESPGASTAAGESGP